MSVDSFFDFDKAEAMRKKAKDILDIISSCGKDVYIFGAGIYADRLQKYLASFGISVSGCVVDDDYAAKTQGELFGLSNVLERDNVCLLFGIGGGFSEWYYSKIAEIKTAVSKCKNSEFYVLSDYWMFDEGYISHDVIDEEFLKEHFEEFKQTYDMMADEVSKSVMKEFLYASVGHDADKLAELGTDKKHDYDLELLFSKPGDGLVIDCGAYDGKTIVEMSEYSHNKYEMIALECEEQNYIKCCETIKGHTNISACKLGVWDKKTKLAVVQSKDASYLKEVDNDAVYDDVVEVVDIDSLVDEKKVAAIIMDIEGSELKALHGARKAILDGATLAVRVYHKKEDLITIPQFIKSINSSYKFYMRFNIGANMCRMADETTLYAICENK